MCWMLVSLTATATSGAGSEHETGRVPELLRRGADPHPGADGRSLANPGLPVPRLWVERLQLGGAAEAGVNTGTHTLLSFTGTRTPLPFTWLGLLGYRMKYILKYRFVSYRMKYILKYGFASYRMKYILKYRFVSYRMKYILKCGFVSYRMKYTRWNTSWTMDLSLTGWNPEVWACVLQDEIDS